MRAFGFRASGGAPPSILCIGAHCDDIEIGCGGLLLELCRAHPGLRVDWFVAIGPEERAAETRRAAANLLAGSGAHHIDVRGFSDGELPYAGADLKRCMRSLGAQRGIDLILTHARDDAHQDHRFLAELTWQTFRDHLILEYEIPKYDGDLGRPNWFVPLQREVVERKISCLLDCFASQRSKPWFDAETFRSLMRLRGMECRSPSGFAEAFYLRKATWDVKGPA